MLRLTKVNWQEPTAYGWSALAISLGLYAGIKCDPARLSRAGSVVIVCGVLLAVSRKIEVLHAKALEFIPYHSSTEFDSILAEQQNPEGSPITKQQREELRQKIYGEAQREIASLIEERRKIFKFHEVAIVITGTLVNGFGDWAIKFYQATAT